MAVESFGELLHKLRVVHEHELEGWQEKVMELTNKKSCDAKRIEELFSRNQQLREQHRILTDNIKELENRLRAGLCDRCTVTQDVAKRRQQEYESSQLQSLQHISLLANEMSSLKKDNERLQEEVKNLRIKLGRQNGHTEEVESPEVKSSPDPPPFVLQPAPQRSDQQPAGGSPVTPTSVKTESESSATTETHHDMAFESTHSQGWNGPQSLEQSKSHASVLTRPISATWRGELNLTRALPSERRALSVDALELRCSPGSSSLSSSRRLSSNTFSLSSSSSSSSFAGDEKLKRQQVHAPVPFRPCPIKNTRFSFPWVPQEQSDWLSMATVTSNGRVVVQPQSHVQDSSSSLLHFPTLLRSGTPQAQPKGWPLTLYRGSGAHSDSRDRRGPTTTAPPSCRSSEAKAERIFGEHLRGGREVQQSEEDGEEGEEGEEAPLDLSESGRSKSRRTPPESIRSPSPQGGEEMNPPDTLSHSHTAASSSSSSSPPTHLSSSSSQHPASPQSEAQTEGQHPQNKKHENGEKETEGKSEAEEEAKDTDSEKKKVQVLTISLCPVVVLEGFKPRGQQQDSSDSKREQDADPRSSSRSEQELQESSPSPTRKRPALDSVTEAQARRVPKEKRIRVTAGSQGKSLADTEEG